MAVGTINEEFRWFCGVQNLTEIDASESNVSDEVTGRPGDSDPYPGAGRLCVASGVGTALHLTFLAAFAVVLVVLRSYLRIPSTDLTKYPQRCRGHGLRWLSTGVLLFLLSCSIGEGLLTDLTRPDIYPTQPYLYLPSLAALLTALTSAFYFNTMESEQRFPMSLLSLLYWTLCFGEHTVNWWSLLQLNLASIHILRFDLTVDLLVTYFVFIILDIDVLYTMVLQKATSYRPTSTEEPVAEDMHYMQDYVSAPSQITLAWLTKLLRLGKKRPLEQKDLGTLPERHTSQENFRRFNEVFQSEKAKALNSNGKVSLFKVFGRFCGMRLLYVGLLKFVPVFLKFVTPAAIRGIVLFASALKLQADGSIQVEQHFITVSEFISNGYILLYILFVCKVINILCMRTTQYYLTIQAVHIRTALQGMVYDKSLRLSLVGGHASNGNTAGKLVNYMTTDPANLQQMFLELHSILVTTISILITMLLLYLLLGFSALIGAVSLVLVMPLITLAGRGMAKFQKKALLLSDGRLKYCNELLQAMKLVKMYGWEDVFRCAIESVRKHELMAIVIRNVFFAMSTTIASAGPILITLVSFATYTLLSGQPLTPEVALPSLSLFFMFENSLFYFPFYISYMVTGVISMRRLQAFLMSSEVIGPSRKGRKSSKDFKRDVSEVTFRPSNGAASSSSGHEVSVRRNIPAVSDRGNSVGDQHELQELQGHEDLSPLMSLPSGVAVKIERGSFSWDSETDPVLHNINIEIPKGQLSAIIGCVGSGKSSLLNAILGEMTTVSGGMLLSSSDAAYVAQKPWIINASVKDNIIIDCDVDQTRYEEVISACALLPDLEELPAGDETEIGEKGINLSGGQKQRISLARALYSRKSIVVMDDPLSALDAHVSQHIVHQGIVGLLSREGRTAILVTNQLNFLPLADHVIVMVEGRVGGQGSLEEIRHSDFGLCHAGPQLVLPSADQTGLGDSVVGVLDKQRATNSRQEQIQNGIKERRGVRKESTATGRLIKAEERQIGVVSRRVYFYLIRMTGCFFLAWIVALFLFNGCMLGRAFKLAEWSEAGLNQTNASSLSGYYIMSYTAWSGASIIAYIICDIARTISSYYATRNLFRRLLGNVTRLPLRFFDTTPTGRILNRFSSDTNSIDQYLFQNLDAVLYNFVEALFFIVLDIIVAPTYLIAVVPLAIINFLVVKFFLASSREIKRLGSISRSPILACFTETLDGLPTIRAYGYQKHFLSILLSKVNDNCTAYLYLQISNLWLNIRLDTLSAIMVLSAGVAALLASSSAGVSASLVGLAIAIAARCSTMISYVARYYGELEIRMNSVERVEHYTSLPTEKYQGIEPSSDWPASGSIEFKGVSARYDVDLMPVLCGIDLQIKPGEKIGICGRTGSGKSSLTLALLHLIDTHEGTVLIDGLDVSRISLSVLRQRLSIIPQDPVLFIGTIRKNLDPTGKKNDCDLWEALQIAQVKDLVSELGGLDFQVLERGENFSMGQRQLFCLARAFLRKSHILIMDEATASIDLEMDKTLQQIVATAFRDQTVLIVAHRVATIMNCDTILVMGGGEIIERGTPQELLAMPDGEFASLVEASGSMAR